MMYGFGIGISPSNRLFSGGGANPNFLMTIDTTKSGSASNTFILPALNTGTYDAVIDWGDGNTSNITDYNDSDLTHVYSVGGTYQIAIIGSFPNIYFNNGGDKLKVLSIDNWGLLPFTSFELSFRGCTNLDILATDLPDFSVITKMGGAFYGCTSLNNFPFANADFSNVTTWVQSGFPAFYGCTSLNNLDFNGMLMNTTTSYDLFGLFYNCNSLTTITGFNTLDLSKCTSLSDVFRGTSLTSINLSGLDLSSCTSLLRVFFSVSSLSSLDVTGITLNSTSNINMTQTFSGLGVCDIVGLDTWNIEKVTTFNSFMSSSTITTTEYDKLLIAWDSQNPVDGLSVNFGTSQYTLGSASATARASLISTDLWTITDGGGI